MGFGSFEIETAEVNPVTVCLNRIERFDLLNQMQGEDFGPILFRQRNVIEIECVLRVYMATQHAIATVNAAVLYDALAIYFFRPGVNANLH